MPRGRPKGSPNKATAGKEAYYAKQGILPIDYMLKIMRDDTEPAERRDDMAKAAIAYTTPKLNAVQHSGSIDLDVHAWLVEAEKQAKT